MKKLLFFVLVLFVTVTYASNDRYRLILTDNPATTVMIGWDQTSGSNPVVHFGTVDFGTNWSNYPFSKSVDRTVSYKGMNNTFAKLSGLTPDTNYYFVIRDSQGTSQRFWFRTAPANNQKMSFISGGDSRNNRTPRQNANLLVSKLKPNAVFFGGDMTDGDSSGEWQDWMDDWQLTTANDGRMFPIIPARGNHEGSNNSIYNLFNVPSTSVYYRIVFGNNLYSIYTLNSEISAGGSQSSWLNSVSYSDNSIWKSAQYHKPMRPHQSSKSEGNDEYSNWSDVFYDRGFDLVFESDSHMVKSTWPVVPCNGGSGCDEGFRRDDANGTVYLGEGCWGAPLRSANDGKNWTRDMGSFNQFKWIWVEESKIEVRTINVNNASSVGSVSNTNPFTIPTGLNIWNPSNGSVITLLNSSISLPQVSITQPADGAQFNSGQTVSIQASATDSDGSVSKVDFYINGNLIATDTSAPYNANWSSTTDGSYTIKAVATDNDGNTQETNERTIYVGQVPSTISVGIASGSDDVEQKEGDGSVYVNSSDLELVYDSYNSQNNQHVGLLFRNIGIPQNATITNAYIQFTCDETSSGTANLTIHAENSGNSADITTATNNITGRNYYSQTVGWSPVSWNSVGQSSDAQQTPALTNLVQQIVNRGDWQQGNKMLFYISGTGTRTAESYEGSSTNAPKLIVDFTVGSGGSNNVPPTVSLTNPADGAQVDEGQNLTLSANATDSDGSISEVQFFVNGNVVGSDSSSPYSVNWTANTAGNYSLYAIATDNDGDTTQSASVSITVNGTGNVCSDTVNSYPYFNGFNNVLGNWTQETNDDFNWSFLNEETPTSSTGPLNPKEGSHYIYMESSSPNHPTKRAILNSPCFDLSTLDNPEVTFDYHMYGSSMGTLEVQISEDGNNWQTLWSKSGNQGNSWNTSTIDLVGYSDKTVLIRFNGITANSYRSDIAIDGFTLANGDGGGEPICDNIRVSITFDNYPEDITWEIKDNNNSTLYSGGPYGSEPDGSTLNIDQCIPAGCYTFIIYDSYGDGLCCQWGNGTYNVTNVTTGSVITTMPSDFSSEASAGFCVEARSTTSSIKKEGQSFDVSTDSNLFEFSIYPNPASNKVFVEVFDVPMESVMVEFYTIKGKIVYKGPIVRSGLDVSPLASGIYMVKIINTNNGSSRVEKLIKE